MSQDSVQHPPLHFSLPALVQGEPQSWQRFLAGLEGDANSPVNQLAASYLAALGRLPMDDEVKGLLPALEPGLQQLLSDSPHLLADPEGWLRPCLSMLLAQALAWYASGKESRDFFEAAQTFVTHVGQGETAAKPLLALINKQQQRALMLEDRARDSELGMAKIQRAQMSVAALLNQLVGLGLPDTVNQFVRTTLKGELQFVLINDGESAPAWKSWQAVIQHLAQVFPVSTGDVEPPNRQQLYREVQILVGLLDEQVTVSASQQEAYDHGVEDLRERLFERLRGQEVPLVNFAPLAEEDELHRAGVSLSPAVSKQAASLKPGQWFLFSPEDGHWIRCKLLLCPPDFAGLFFVNRSGQRVLTKTPQEFSACLATGVARPLKLTGVYEQLLEQALAPLAQKAEAVLEAKAAQAEAQVDTDSHAAPRTEVSIPQEQEAEPSPDVPITPATNRKSAAEKALQEAWVLDKLQQRRESRELRAATADAEAAPATDQDRRVLASDQVENLNIGALLDIELAGELRRCKLVAIMRANEFYIFTDRRGVKVAELEKANLLTLLTEGKAQVHSQGDNFEGQLTKVVKTLRREH